MAKGKRKLCPDDFEFDDNQLGEITDFNSNDALVEYTKKHPKQPCLLASDGQGMLMTSSIAAIKSQPGQGKTKACCLLAAGALGGAHEFGLDPVQDKVIVRYFDTELPKQMTCESYNIIKHLAPMPCHDASLLFMTNLVSVILGTKKDSSEEFFDTPWPPQKIEKFIMSMAVRDCAITYGTGARLLYIVDGVAQLVDDPNDMQECKQFTERWCHFVNDKPVCVLFVIHENIGKANENGKMIGHLGSFIQKQAREVYRTARPGHGDIFTITNNSDDCKYSFGARLPEVDFSIDKDGFLVPAESPTSVANEKKAATRRGILEDNFKSAFTFCHSSRLNYTSLKTAYSAVSKSSERTASRAIKDAWSLDILKQDKEGYYMLASVMVSNGVK